MKPLGISTDRAAVYARRKEDYLAAEQQIIDANAAKWKAACEEIETWVGKNPEEAEKMLAVWSPHMKPKQRRELIEECKRKLKYGHGYRLRR